MSYFKIGDKDFSLFVNQLTVNRAANYNAQTNAAGNTVVDLINHKRTIDVGFIPMDGADMVALQNAINAFNVSISFINPLTGGLEEGINCIIPSSGVDFYTIQIGKVMYKTFTLQFVEL